MSLLKSLFLAAVSASTAIATSGQLTYYTETSVGACGKPLGGSETGPDYVAVDPGVYGVYANPNDSPVCGKWMKISKGGKSIRAQVWDRCAGCDPGNVDVPPTLFTGIADLSVGRTEVTWEWDDGTGGDTPVVSTTQVAAPTTEAPVPTTTSQVVVVPTTTSQAPVPTTTSEVVVIPSSTSVAVVVPSSTSTSVNVPTTFSTRVQPATTSSTTSSSSSTSTAAATTSRIGQQLVEKPRVHVVVVTQWVTSTVTARPTSF